MRTRGVLALSAGLAAALILGTLVDRVFYQEWVIAPLNYFRVNIIEHKAETYGHSPWWSYFAAIPTRLGPPMGLVVEFAVLAAWIRRPRSLVTWSMVPFVVAHAAVAHKEFRFLFPLATLSVLVTLRSLDDARLLWPRAWAWWGRNGWARALLVLMAVDNVFLLGASALRPTQQTMPMFQYIAALPAPQVIYDKAGEQPYAHGGGLEPRFYEPASLRLVDEPDLSALAKQIDRGAAWIVLRGFHIPPASGPLVRECVAKKRTLPDWVEGYNFNHWLDRTPVWTLYWCEKKSGA